jgi:hypothetical protein
MMARSGSKTGFEWERGRRAGSSVIKMRAGRPRSQGRAAKGRLIDRHVIFAMIPLFPSEYSYRQEANIK